MTPRGRDPFAAAPRDLEDSLRVRPHRDSHAGVSRRGARVDCQRREDEVADAAAPRMRMESSWQPCGGNIEEERACGMAAGTRIEVRELFFNTPARLKFMKTHRDRAGRDCRGGAETRAGQSSIAFSLAADGRAAVFDFRARTRRWSASARSSAASSPHRCCNSRSARNGFGVSGLATMSQESFATPRMIFTFVNGRAVRDKLLSRAVDAGVSDADAARTPSGGGAVSRDSARRRRRQRASDEDRGAVSKIPARFSKPSIMRCATGSRIRPIPRASDRCGNLPRSMRSVPRCAAMVSRCPRWRRWSMRTPAQISQNSPLAQTRDRAPLRLVADNARIAVRVSAPAEPWFQRPPSVATTAARRCAKRRCRCTRR